jgi:D-alanyl-D-alanine endopeptidase (penicillin-binding protein 7)
MRWLAPLGAVFLLGALALPAVAAKRSGDKPAAVSAKTTPVKATNRDRRAAAPVRKAKPVRAVRAARVVPERPSFGQVAGLRGADDPLELKSSVALVVDQDTNEILFSKNSQAVLPIASLTKLMTALVVTEANLPLDEPIAITDDDIDTEKGSRSRLKVGTVLTRGQMLHLALMSSENRAANALGRAWPKGLRDFVVSMNRKARELGMLDTHYVEPTGLSPLNQSSARDLAILVKAAHEHPMIRELSTSPEQVVDVGSRPMQFRNTNGLVKDPDWHIGLQKTGYISEAGRCLVMQAQLAGRQLIMVFLDSAGKYTRIADAERVRRWVTQAFDGRAVQSAGAPSTVMPATATTTVPAPAIVPAAATSSLGVAPL